MRIGVLTSGGDSPGMNAAVHSLTKACIAAGHTPVGICDGYSGLLAGEHEVLTLQRIDGISRYGGTFLGTARSSVFPTPAGQAQAKEQLRALALDGLVVIGGNGSLAGARALAQGGAVRVVGLPASIDNDIGYTHVAIGVDTAVNTIVEACDRISDTADSHRRAFIVEVMGRHCGYLAMRAGVAADADAILFSEEPHELEATVERLTQLMRHSFSPERRKRRVLIVKAEGVDISAQILVDRLDGVVPDIGVRLTVLGHVVRGGSPSALDRLIAQRLAVGALQAILDGDNDVMMSWHSGVGTPTQDIRVSRVPLHDVLEETARMLDLSSPDTQQRVKMARRAEALLAL